MLSRLRRTTAAALLAAGAVLALAVPASAGDGPTNVGAGPNHFDLAVVIDFADIDAFRRYIGGAVHRAYVEGPAKAAVGRLAVVQHHC